MTQQQPSMIHGGWRRPFLALLHGLEGLFDRAFGQAWNPVRQAGTLAFFFFWVAAVSGIYVYIFFETSVGGAFGSVESMTHEQWYLAGVMRSLHRYSSDAMVVAAAVHLTREFLMDRYRGVRWFAWVTGVPVLWLLYTSGISGYWLVWDQLAQYVAIGSMEWIDGLGIFGAPAANNFLTRGSLSDRFFSLLVFTHIFVPLFLLFVMWIHVMRVSRPRINPSRGLALGSLAMLTILSLVKPAVSHAAADLGVVPHELNLDWFFMIFYPLFDAWGAIPTWVAAAGLSVVVAAMPWLPPMRQRNAAQVTLARCNGCARCVEDCPYGAVAMKPRSDGLPYTQEAVVDAADCTRCGICVGACPTSTPFRQEPTLVTGIDLPDDPLQRVKADLITAMEQPAPTGQMSILLFGCAHGIGAESAPLAGVRQVVLPCIGMLPPSFIDFALSRGGMDGVILSGCWSGDCYHRFGVEWMEERVAGARDPYLRARVDRHRLRLAWADVAGPQDLRREILAFAEKLSGLADRDAGGSNNEVA